MEPPRSTRTRALRSETRQKILDAAVERFASDGIAASSVSDIARAAGLTKGAVYSNFASKDDLILTLMDEHVLERLATVAAVFEAAQDVDLAIHDLGAAMMAAVYSDESWRHLLQEYAALARHDAGLRERLAEHRGRTRGAIARAIERIAEQRGIVPPDERRRSHRHLPGTRQRNRARTRDRSAAVPDDLFPRLMDLILGQADPGPAAA